MKTIANIIHHKTSPLEILDDQYNQVYIESDTGYWWKKGYDDRGNQTYREDSFGGWWKFEYNDKGNQIYYEDSNGHIRDARP